MKAILIALSCTIVACSSANLKSAEINTKQKTTNQGVDLYQSYYNQNCKQIPKKIQFSGTDTWPSWLIRQFTPIDSEVQRIQGEITKEAFLLTLIDGENEKRSFKLEADELYRFEEGSFKPYSSSKTKIYLSSTRDYITFRCGLLQNQVRNNLSMIKTSDANYKRMFLSKSETFNDEVDQYIVHINDTSKQLDAIQFTMRNFMKSYSGYALYKEKILKDGKRALTISIQDKLDGSDFDHQFNLTIERIQ